MNALKKKVQAFLADEQGATAVEYGLMVALIAIAIVVAVTAVGNQLIALFNDVVSKLGGTVGGGG